ncbi:hypothetical protein chiPu_0014758 [Chiloscyllium punctatum]|uniref:Uncharacterized protein n=1 Tax=Chiloscyllium punctatum TaxID=137246 RepID=A0A401T0W9_CHIPU|nr:hypothetical protein [Chiloscyllium punctatum]
MRDSARGRGSSTNHNKRSRPYGRVTQRRRRAAFRLHVDSLLKAVFVGKAAPPQRGAGSWSSDPLTTTRALLFIQ